MFASLPQTNVKPPAITNEDLARFHKEKYGNQAPSRSLLPLGQEIPRSPRNESVVKPASRQEHEDHGEYKEHEEIQEHTQSEEADELELGHYPDGVKRTLTDSQIAMFRHSEIYNIIRARQVAKENAEDDLTSMEPSQQCLGNDFIKTVDQNEQKGRTNRKRRRLGRSTHNRNGQYGTFDRPKARGWDDDVVNKVQDVGSLDY